MFYPEPVENLIGMLKQLPGIGRRGAERAALAMLEWGPDRLTDFGRLVGELPLSVSPCPDCGAWAPAGEKCAICSDPRRDDATLCVVETAAQLFAVEHGGAYRGKYLVLGGKISPLDSKTGENLNLSGLLRRVASGEVREVILALSPDVEGRATALYLAELLGESPVRISQPAMGLPAGANLSFADGATIAAAFGGRIAIREARNAGK